MEQKALEEFVETLKELFGDRLVDPDVFPRIFEFQVKLARYELTLKKEKVD